MKALPGWNLMRNFSDILPTANLEGWNQYACPTGDCHIPEHW